MGSLTLLALVDLVDLVSRVHHRDQLVIAHGFESARTYIVVGCFQHQKRSTSGRSPAAGAVLPGRSPHDRSTRTAM